MNLVGYVGSWVSGLGRLDGALRVVTQRAIFIAAAGAGCGESLVYAYKSQLGEIKTGSNSQRVAG